MQHSQAPPPPPPLPAVATFTLQNNAETLADEKAVETLRKMAKQRLDSIQQFRQVTDGGMGGESMESVRVSARGSVKSTFCPRRQRECCYS